MKILALADEESKYLWDYFEREKLEGIDLLISCGDLKPRYLSFLATFTTAPVLYVHGNHDGCYDRTPPEGCTSIEDDIYVFNGIRILGLGGSMKYNGGPHQYTEKEMQKRIRKLKRKINKHKGFDILVTHSPAFGINDGEDLPHTGFKVFHELLETYKPKYFIHCHMHTSYDYRLKMRREVAYNEHTTIIHAYERYLFEYPTS